MFFASVNNVSYENKLHIEGYFWAKEVEGYSFAVAFALYYNLVIIRDNNLGALKKYMFRKCKTIEKCKNSKTEYWFFYKSRRSIL